MTEKVRILQITTTKSHMTAIKYVFSTISTPLAIALTLILHPLHRQKDHFQS